MTRDSILTEPELNILRGIFVEHKELPVILEKHGEATGRMILNHLNPRLESIEKRLDEGTIAFKEESYRITKNKEHLATLQFQVDTNKKTIGCVKECVDNMGEDKTEKTLRRVVKWVSIIGSIMVGMAGIVMGVLYTFQVI